MNPTFCGHSDLPLYKTESDGVPMLCEPMGVSGVSGVVVDEGGTVVAGVS